MSKTPFEKAERYIQLRKKCMPPSWMDTILRFNEMILSPIFVVYLILTRTGDLFAVLSSVMTIYAAWSEWLEFQDLRMEVQNMFLRMMASGGPCIRTNDPEYMPYVFADAVVRLDEHHPRP